MTEDLLAPFEVALATLRPPTPATSGPWPRHRRRRARVLGRLPTSASSRRSAGRAAGRVTNWSPRRGTTGGAADADHRRDRGQRPGRRTEIALCCDLRVASNSGDVEAGLRCRHRAGRLAVAGVGERHGGLGAEGVVTSTVFGFSPRLRRVISSRPSMTMAAQVLLLELRLLHQPVREAAQQLGLRAAAFEAARPQPDLIGQQLRDAALADAVEDEQRLVVGAAHHGVAACAGRRRTRRNQRPQLGFVGRAAPGRSAVTGWRRPSSVTAGRKPLLDHVAGRLAPAARRRAACGRGSSGPAKLTAGGVEQRAAVLDVVARCCRNRRAAGRRGGGSGRR